MIITCYSTFHNTAHRIRANPGDMLSPYQIRKLECAGNCLCGGALGQYGWQSHPIVPEDGGYQVIDAAGGTKK